MDRRLAGMLMISAVISTVLSIGLFEVGVDEAVRVVVNTFPENMPRAGYGRPRFILDLVADRDLPDVVLEYSILRKTNTDPVAPWNMTDATDWEPEELFDNVPILRETQAWFERCSREGLNLPIAVTKVPLEYGGNRAEMNILDYTDAFRALGLGPGQLNSTYMIWAIIVDQSGNVFTYSGIRDFFFDRLRIIHGLEIGDGKVTRSFASPKMPIELRGERPGMDLAPLLGTIHVRDVSEGDRIHIFLELMAERIFPHEGLVQLVTIRVGGEETKLVNVMGSSTIP